jgi:hypothetical protein
MSLAEGSALIRLLPNRFMNAGVLTTWPMKRAFFIFRQVYLSFSGVILTFENICKKVVACTFGVIDL